MQHCVLRDRWDLNSKKLSEEETEELLDHADICEFHAGLLEGFNQKSLPKLKEKLPHYVLPPSINLLDKKTVYAQVFYGIFVSILNTLLSGIKTLGKLFGNTKIDGGLFKTSTVSFSLLMLTVTLLAMFLPIIEEKKIYSPPPPREAGFNVPSPSPKNVASNNELSVIGAAEAELNVGLTKQNSPPLSKRQKKFGSVNINVEETSIDSSLPDNHEQKVEISENSQTKVLKDQQIFEAVRNDSSNTDNHSQAKGSEQVRLRVVPEKVPKVLEKEQTLEKDNILYVTVKLNKLPAKDFGKTICILSSMDGKVRRRSHVVENSCTWEVEKGVTYSVSINHPQYILIAQPLDTRNKTSILRNFNMKKIKP